MGYTTEWLLVLVLCSGGLLRVEAEEGDATPGRFTRETLQRDCYPQRNPVKRWCYYTGTKYIRHGTGGSWWRSTKYSKVKKTFTYMGCCSGYGGWDCQAMCHSDPHVSACNRQEGLVIHKDGVRTTCSGGACVRPNRCENCNTGYYADDFDGYCRACRPIDHCNIPRCSNHSSSVCSWCDGEVTYNTPGMYAYTYHVDPHRCLRSCSWRQDTRCYPGVCNGDMLYPSDCTCARGFEGSDCATFSSSALDMLKINSPEMTLASDIKLVIPDPVYPDRKVWTKKVDWSKVSLEVPVSFEAPPIEPESRQKQTYIDFNNTKIGISGLTVDAVLTRVNSTISWRNELDCTFNASCTLRKMDVAISNTKWNNILMGGYPTPFAHRDTVEITISVTNGGYVYYTNRETNSSESYNINGKTATRILELEFDLYPPVHCIEDKPPCGIQPLVTPDFVQETTFEVTWDGWQDEDAGIKLYRFEVFLLKVMDQATGILKSGGQNTFSSEVNGTERSTYLNVSQPGAYFVEMSAVDWAGNEMATRRMFLFDDESVVTLRGNASIVATADPLTDYKWINRDSDLIEVIWPGRFINERHLANGWLNEVASSEHISRELDDTVGKSNRTTAALHNIQGVVRFTVGYNISYGFNNTDDLVEAVIVEEDMFDQQKINIQEDCIDGKRLTFFIRGYDVMDEFAEDNTTVTIDLSPPVIEHMWLTKGDILNITVHSEEELNQLTIEWEAFDIHSGLNMISWRIFDNFTKTDIEHGTAHETTQGEAETIEECEKKYSNHSRGARCYCTPFNGCFHKHYQIKPQVTTTGSSGLLAGMDKGVHESDYFIEVRAVNSALLETVSTIKVTIDTSPPHSGSVHDGYMGQPEVDFQQSRDLTSYWNGFFDKESSIWFYVYGYGTECLPSSEFDIAQSTANTSQMLVKTYTTDGSYTAPTSGTYYVTVVAFNHALDHSTPVCSDGVTVDDTEADVSEVIVKGSVTRAGLIKDSADRVWFLRRDRVRAGVINPSKNCLSTATLVSDVELSVLPYLRYINGTEKGVTSDVCRLHTGVHPHMVAFVTSDEHLDISWNVTNSSVSIHDFEVGLSSGNSTPDRMDFVSSRQHQHIRLVHPNIWDGEEFFIIIRTITKAAVKKDTIVGPFAVDTTQPDFQGTVNVDVEHSADGHHIVVTWQPNAFTDHGDPAPLSFQVGIGSVKYGHNVLPFQRLSPGCSCKVPITCTAINIDRLNWHLHGHQRYYVTVKASNTDGMYTLASSDEYIHDVELPTTGVVYDIDIDNDVLLQDIVDIDFQTRTDRLSSRWSGFFHPHVNVTFAVCIQQETLPGSSNAIECDNVDQKTEHTFYALNLKPFKTYTQTVTAMTEAGNVTVSSDGITIVTEDIALPNVTIKDGLECVNSLQKAINTNTSHHAEDKRLECQDDVDFQASSNYIKARWTVPHNVQSYTPDVYWAIEERAPIADIWSEFRSFEHLKTSRHLSVSNLALMAGRHYRVVLKFCATKYCFMPVHSNGFTVLSRPPTPGSLLTSYDNTTNLIDVQLSRFYDPDVEDPDDARDAVENYEWAFTDSSDSARLLTKWETLNMSQSRSQDKLHISIPVSPNVTFTKCWKLAVRGYNKAGLSSIVSKEIRNCSDVTQVRPHVIIDAVGQPLGSGDSLTTVHEGLPVVLSENSDWLQDDKDYTSYSNILSAVWPTLRYKSYIWAVLELQNEDSSVFYKSKELTIVDPCNHPDAIRCGRTGLQYMNAMFSRGELVHGRRYSVCVHANATTLHFEKWTQELSVFNACSDGITIDLTPPTPSPVWIGKNIGGKYQSSSTCLTVNWQSFIDVEEEGHSAHISGVEGYQVAIGSAHGGVDIVDFVKVGLTNHHMFHGLHLQDGHSYFATVKATDFTGQMSMEVSRPVVVDVSPPVTTGQPIKLPGRLITDTDAISACWKGVFSDPESGLSHFEWSVGSQRGYDDVMPYTLTEDECGESDSSVPLGLFEGHAFFVSVKAYNYASHYTLAVSWAFTVDASAPTAGHVYDGSRRQDGSFHDVDYIDKTSMIEAHWSEFYEVHGTVKEYTVSVGSCVACDDILARQPVGIIYDVVLTNLHLSEGQIYYVTTTACNTADLCTSSTSDGVLVDKTPPIPGRVLDGVEGKDIQYQASRLFIGAKWFGFIDAQSGISHYVWRVGTSPETDDILPATEVHKLQEAFIVDLSAITGNKLPVGVRIYITIRAYNKAGMHTESTSNGFIVDSSGPLYSRHLSTTNIGSAKQNTSVLPHVIRVEWEVADNESFIDEQYLSIVSHIGGDFNASSIKVEGIVRDYTFTDLDLHDGSVYCVTLVSCNGARICSETRLEHLLVDSSHPTPGMFAINTDHSAALDRQPEDWMTWTVPYIRLAWLGFQDVHSGIDHYLINIGSYFMGNDLHKMSTDPHVVPHSNLGNRTDEGVIQTQQISTKSLVSYKTLFISIWAVNGVGLPSPIIHHEFELAFGGSMELVRRCDAHTCLGHCVCAPHGELCHTDKLCTDVTKGNVNYILTLKDFTDLFFPTVAPVINHSPTQTLSAAKWSVLKEQGKAPIWYEWSVGETIYDKPKGVFDITQERVWYDAGQNMSWILSHHKGHYLKEKQTYSFFVRVWYDRETFAIFRSPGVMVYTTPPQTISVQGKMVKETVYARDKDADFIDENTSFIVDWTGKFSNDKCLTRYHLYISTTRGGHDAYCIRKNLPTTVTAFNLTGYHFERDTVYYSVVQAYNMAGLHTTETSDGFRIDGREPFPGIVNDGEVFTDIYASNMSNDISTFWYGFSDQDSGIRAYNVCISRQSDRKRCQIHPPIDVGLETKARLFTNLTVPDGTILLSEVQAFDFVGHSTRPVRSNGLIIDTSPPTRSRYLTYQNNRVQNPSFEISDLDHSLRDIEQLTKCDNKPPPEWIPTDHSCVLTVTAGKDQLLPGGQHFVVITGAMQQRIGNLTVGEKYRLRFFSSHIPMKNAMISSCEGHVKINHEKHVFMLYGKPELSKDNTDSAFNLSWHEHIYFFEARDPEVTMTIGTEGMTNHLALDNILFEQRSEHLTDEDAAISGHVKARTVFIHDWSSVHAQWNFEDDHCEIVEYHWAVGTVEGGTQLQPFTSVGKRTFAFTSSLHLVHDTTIYVTVIAVNAASLRTVSYSDPILIDLTPPTFKWISDGPVRGEDIDFQRELTIHVNWEVDDLESDIALCRWAVYTGNGETLVNDFEEIQTDAKNATANVKFVNLVDDLVYVTVVCANKAGLSSHVQSDGVKIVTAPPSVDNVLIEVIGSSSTQYSVHDRYHGNASCMNFRWTGFEDDEGIDSYLIALDGKDIHAEELVTGNTVGFTYASFTDLDLPDGNYTVSVTAINLLDMYSRRQSKDFILMTAKPLITGSPIKTKWTPDNNDMLITWPDVFASSSKLYYEVTVSWSDGGDGDIVQWEETKDTTLDISLNLEDVPEAGINVRVSVRAITPAGRFDTTNTEQFITKN